MLLKVLDGVGESQTIIAQGQEVLTDRSGTITAANEQQPLMAANPERAGWFFQNLGSQPMTLNEIGGDATVSGFQVQPLAFFPPPGYPVTLTAINLVSAEQDAKFAAREW